MNKSIYLHVYQKNIMNFIRILSKLFAQILFGFVHFIPFDFFVIFIVQQFAGVFRHRYHVSRYYFFQFFVLFVLDEQRLTQRELVAFIFLTRAQCACSHLFRSHFVQLSKKVKLIFFLKLSLPVFIKH